MRSCVKNYFPFPVFMILPYISDHLKKHSFPISSFPADEGQTINFSKVNLCRKYITYLSHPQPHIKQ